MPNPKYNQLKAAKFAANGQVIEVDPMAEMTAKDRRKFYDLTDGVARRVTELAEIITEGQAFISEWFDGIDEVELYREDPQTGSKVTVKVQNPADTLAQLASALSMISDAFSVEAEYQRRGGGGERAPKASKAKEKLAALKAKTAARK